MIVNFDKTITTDCPLKVGKEVFFTECVGCRYFGGQKAFQVTCWRNENLSVRPDAQEAWNEHTKRTILGLNKQGDKV